MRAPCGQTKKLREELYKGNGQSGKRAKKQYKPARLRSVIYCQFIMEIFKKINKYEMYIFDKT